MLLRGAELVGVIRERQAKEVEGLKAMPKLVIVLATEDPASLAYTLLKQNYGREIGVRVEIQRLAPAEIAPRIEELNKDPAATGIIVQLPLPPSLNVNKILNALKPSKDIDGLGKNSKHQPATPTAILWLLEGHKIDLKGKEIAIVGRGRLVGQPLAKILSRTHKNLIICNEKSKNLPAKLKTADVIISATGQPHLIRSEWIKPGAVVIDAGTASEEGVLVGDVSRNLYSREDVKVSPVPGGVGPLTVCALFENLIKAAKS